MLTVVYMYENNPNKARCDFKSLVKSFTESHVLCTVKEHNMELTTNDLTFKFTSNPEVVRGLDKRTAVVHNAY